MHHAPTSSRATHLPTAGARARRALGSALAIAAAGLLSPGLAHAHFVLQEPASSMSQDFLGSPQKLGPCGDEAGGTPTGTVTTFQQGQTITVTIDETIFHPGHYRISLAVNDRSELPEEPIVTAGSSPCGSAPIQDPPVFPVLADGVFAHTAPFSGPQTVQITLPPDVTCTHCTLQVLEFMAQHPLNNPGGCYYHHCADLAIEGATAADAGAETSTEPDASDTADGAVDDPDAAAPTSASGAGSSGGCAVSRRPASPGAAFGGLLALAALALRRRARR